MRFLLDENVPRTLALALAARGHDVKSLPLELCGAADPAVLREAANDHRTLVTLDTDFGTLVFAERREPPPAVVLIRLPPVVLVERPGAIVGALEQALGTAGVFAVIDSQGVRVRPLPRAWRTR